MFGSHPLILRYNLRLRWCRVLAGIILVVVVAFYFELVLPLLPLASERSLMLPVFEVVHHAVLPLLQQRCDVMVVLES